VFLRFTGEITPFPHKIKLNVPVFIIIKVVIFYENRHS